MKAFLPDQTRLSQVHLRTVRLETALAFYSSALGLKVLSGRGYQPTLSANAAGPGLIVLSEEPQALRRPPGSVGLFHIALRYPERRDLVRAYRRLSESSYPVLGASDHGVSEAIYLSDSDGNGVELYADRPRAQWPRRDGQIAMVTQPLDLEDLLNTTADGPASVGLRRGRPATTNAPEQTELGHIHLHVTDLAAAEQFYNRFLGLAVTQRTYPGALFFAAGGYHHHVGVNIWGGKTAAPANSVGLISYRFEVPVAEVLYCLRHRAPLLGYETRTEAQSQGPPILQIRDPNGHWLEVQAAKSTGAGHADFVCGASGAGVPTTSRWQGRT